MVRHPELDQNITRTRADVRLTGRPQDGSMKSAQNPSLCRAEQICWAPPTNYTKTTTQLPSTSEQSITMEYIQHTGLSRVNCSTNYDLLMSSTPSLAHLAEEHLPLLLHLWTPRRHVVHGPLSNRHHSESRRRSIRKHHLEICANRHRERGRERGQKVSCCSGSEPQRKTLKKVLDLSAAAGGRAGWNTPRWSR